MKAIAHLSTTFQTISIVSNTLLVSVCGQSYIFVSGQQSNKKQTSVGSDM